MNKITYIEVFTTMNVDSVTTYVRFRRQNASYKTHHEVHKIETLHQANRLNKALKKTCTIGGGTVGPWGIMSFVYYPIPTGTPVDAHPVEETGSNFYICPACHKKNNFTAWLFAHWDIDTEHTCACGIKSILKRGKVIKLYPAEGNDYVILSTKYIPAPDSQQIVYVAVAGVANDWAGYVGVFPTAVNSKHAAQRAAELGVKLFEAEAKGMFPEHTDWKRDYRR